MSVSELESGVSASSICCARKAWTEVTKRRIAAEQKYLCAHCQHLLGLVWAADHRVPLHLGGTNAKSNCQILCVGCHALKTQQEMIRAADQRRETTQGKSKYWDERSESFMFQRAEDPRLANACRRIQARLKSFGAVQ